MSTHPHVLAAVDLDVSTGIVLETAIREALQRPNADLIVFYVFQFLSADFIDARRRADTDATIAELKLRTQQALQAYALAHEGVVLPRAEVNVAVGRPADEVIWAAAHFDVDLIVMGSHSRKGVARFLMGSVAEKVVRLAGCPVNVVREKNHDPKVKLVEIEPLCPDCASTRFETNGKKLWCARHSEHHVFGHVVSSADRSESPQAWSSTTGS